MFRPSVRALEVLLERQPLQQPALQQLLQRGTAAARSTAQGGAQQLWRRPMMRSIATEALARPRRPALQASTPSPFSTSRAPAAPRRTFYSSRARRAQEEGPKSGSGSGGNAGRAAGEAGSQSGSGSSGAGSGSSAAAESLTLGARLKRLFREYGWTATGVYFALSLLDFPFCFLLVRNVGTERIAAVEEYVVSYVKAVIPAGVQDYYHEYRAALKKNKSESAAAPTGSEDEAGWGVKEAEERNQREASLATQLALAYAIHKSFIFVRVPLAVAVTPRVVKLLRSWGWKIGKAKPAA